MVFPCGFGFFSQKLLLRRLLCVGLGFCCRFGRKLFNAVNTHHKVRGLTGFGRVEFEHFDFVPHLPAHVIEVACLGLGGLHVRGFARMVKGL